MVALGHRRLRQALQRYPVFSSAVVRSDDAGSKEQPRQKQRKVAIMLAEPLAASSTVNVVYSQSSGHDAAVVSVQPGWNLQRLFYRFSLVTMMITGSHICPLIEV